MVAIFGLLLGLSGVAHGALTTYDFKGTVDGATDWKNVGKTFETIIYADATNSLLSWEYLIGGKVIESFGPDSVTLNSSSIKTTPFFSFISEKGDPSSDYIHYSLVYDPAHNNTSFLKFAITDATGTLNYITAGKLTSTPIPAAAWLLGSGLLGLLGLKRRENEA